MRGFAFVEMTEDAQEDAAITHWMVPNGWGVNSELIKQSREAQHRRR